MQARIFRTPKAATQSGRANSKRWTLEYEPNKAKSAEPLMGWTSSDDTMEQLRLRFDSKEEAVAFAQKKGLMYSVEEPAERKVAPKAYADNFRSDRLSRWTH
ncbi:ETC complex I subunit [Rhodovibrionaceae bacterium A322]